MKNYILFIFIFLLAITSKEVNAQNVSKKEQLQFDSLNAIINSKANNYRAKYDAYIFLGDFFQFSNTDTAFFYHSKALKMAEKIPGIEGEIKKGEALRLSGWDSFLFSEYDKAIEFYRKSINIAEKHVFNPEKKIQYYAKKLLATSLSNLGIIFSIQGEYDKALENYNKAIQLGTEIDDKVCLSKTFGNVGIIYDKQGDFVKALDYYFKALKMNEETNNKRNQAANLGNIGSIYFYQKDYTKCLEYYFKALKINEEINSQSGQGANLGNIGAVYYFLKDHLNATKYLNQALKINEEIGNKNAQGDNLGNIGSVCELKEENEMALEYYFKALQMHEDVGNIGAQASHLGRIGALYIKMKKYDKAEYFLKQAEKMNREMGIIFYLKDNCADLSDLYNIIGKNKEALFYYKEHIIYRDSLENEENQKALIQKEIHFAYEKKSAADSVAFVKEKEIKEVEIAKQKIEIKTKRNQQYALFSGLFLVLVFAGIMYNRFKITQKQKVIIEEKEKETNNQKHIIEEKHKEITDSINYAERIQRSFLATTELLDENLKDYFVYFQPKDVVSGDFYFASTLKNGDFAICCADSTGHGVPGAIMSIANIACLKEAVTKGLQKPDEILNETRKLVIEYLKNDGSPEGGKDGMDCSLVVINPEKTKISFALAQNPIWIIRKGELIEFKPDKMPVGKHDKDHVPFTLHNFDIEKGDIIYTLTDGMPDQFGGPKGKKFLYKNLKDLIVEISDKLMAEQNEILSTTLQNWKGDLEQVDDVCIIGVRV